MASTDVRQDGGQRSELRRRVITVYGTAMRVLSGVFLIGAVGFVIAALISPSSDLWPLAAIAGGYGVVLGGMSLMWGRFTERTGVPDGQMNPLREALLVIDWVDGARLGELAAQKDILPAPRRRERSRGRKQSGGVQGGVGPIRPELGYEASESELAVYELPENRTLLLAEVVGALLRDQQLELDIADVPRVSVDAPLDEQEIESLLLRELDKGTSQSDLRTVAREAAAILGRGLPPERLAAAKREELAGLKSGVYVLVESEWTVTSTASEVALRLESLHPPNEIELTSATRVQVPAGIEVATELRIDELTPRARLRFQGVVGASLFGEVLTVDSGSVTIWPIALFSRTPSLPEDSGKQSSQQAQSR